MTDHTASENDARDLADEISIDSPQLVVDDLLLLLFDPASDSIRAENILFYVLAGGALTDLGMAGAVTVDDRGMRGKIVTAVDGARPADPLLALVWDKIAAKPREVQGVLAMVGPALRTEVIDRLIERGHLRREARKMLGFIPATALVDADVTRRDELVAQMREVLVDGATPDERTASLIALISASRALPQFDREIPWSSDVATRAKQLEKGDVEAGASAAAVSRTMNAIIVNSIVGAGVAAGVIAHN